MKIEIEVTALIRKKAARKAAPCKKKSKAAKRKK
jgi:hypothetical protein